MADTQVPAGKYMYCIIRCPEPRRFSSHGLGEWGETVYTINYQDLAVVVSDSPVIEYDNTRRNMMTHTLVLEEVMRDGAILPVRFGIVAPSSEVIQAQLLQRRYNEFLGLLARMEGRLEVGLKAFWYEQVIFQEIIDQNPAIRQLRDRLLGYTVEETYHDRIHLGEMIELAMNNKRDEDAAKLLSRLRPLADETRINKVLTDRMVLNAAFLLHREREPEFDAAIQALDAELGQRLIFKYVNNAPPYNFVNVLIRWDATTASSAEEKGYGTTYQATDISSDGPYSGRGVGR